jgi:polyphosphate kinase
MTDIELDNPELYFNRELSLLEFNWRVLQQALDTSVPLLERLNYLCISSTNLDEFF